MNSTEKFPTQFSFLNTYEKEDLNKKLLDKVISDLSNKYRNILLEKNFNLLSYKNELLKEIELFCFYQYPFYNKLFQQVEKTFLKELNNYNYIDKQGYFTNKDVNYLCSFNNKTADDLYYTYNLEKVTIRGIIKNEINDKVVDKYKLRKEKPKEITKNEIRSDYSKKISLGNKKKNK